MKKSAWYIISSLACVFYILALVVPARAAPSSQVVGEDPTWIFHIRTAIPYSSDSLPTGYASIVPDAPEEIVITGKVLGEQSGNVSIGYFIKNLCGIYTAPGTTTPTVTPTPLATATATTTPVPSICGAADIYYTFSVSIQWNNTYYSYEQSQTMNLAPRIHYQIGGYDQTVLEPDGHTWSLPETISEYCGPEHMLQGGCTQVNNGIIAYDDWAHEAEDVLWSEQFSAYSMADHVGLHQIMTYNLVLSTKSLEDDCNAQWTTGTRFANITLAATNSTGVNIAALPGWPAPGSWIRIEVANDTHWFNNGSPPGLTSLAAKIPMAGGASEDVWHPLAGDLYTGCSNATSYYFQIATPWAVNIRVNDTDGNFAANTMSLDLNFYTTTYTPFPTACDANYKIGALIETESLPATNSAGIYMGTGVSNVPASVGVGSASVDLRYMVLETNIGPHYDGGNYSYSGEIYTGSSWVREINLPTATCVVPLDTIGRVRVYFPYDAAIKTWLFRGYDIDGIWSNNQGTAGYTLKYADLLQVYPPGGPSMDCTSYFTHAATPVITLTLQGNSSTAISIPTTGGQLYAIETSGGPWINNAAQTWGVAMSNDGTTWRTLYDFDYVLCATGTDGYHVIIYFQALQGTHYYLRVDEQDGVFSDNSASIDAKVYTATYIQHPWSVCTADYIINQMDIPLVNRTIPANLEQGINIPYITHGKYALEISGESTWNKIITEIGYDRFDAEISDDGGATWQDYESASFVICTVVIQDGAESFEKRYRIVFSSGGTFQIRVNDLLLYPYPMHVGNLIYILSSVSSNEVIPPPGTNPPYTPPGWQSSCYGICPPTSLIVWQAVSFGTLGNVNLPLPNVGGWFESSRCAIQKFISWCPEHTTALAGIPGMFSGYEPFGTIKEFQDGASSLNQQLDSSIATGGEGSNFAPYSVIFNASGGESGGSSWQGFLPVMPETSPWVGGKLEWNNGNGLNPDGPVGGESDAAYVEYCHTVFDANLGVPASTGLCSALDMARAAPKVWIMIQLFVDVGAITGFIKYVMAKWIDLAGSA